MEFTDDPELASQMLGLLSKELKAARVRIDELESQIQNERQNDTETYKERAEAAEYAMELLRKNYEDLTAENRLLRMSLEESKDTKKLFIKKERNEPQIVNMVDKSVSTDNACDVDPEKKELERALETYYAKYQAKKQARKELMETCKDMEGQLSKIRAEYNELALAKTQTGPPEPKSSSSTEEYAASSPLPAHPTWKELDSFMLNLPRQVKSKRPRYQKLRPICHRSTDLKSYLASDPQTSNYSTSFLYLPDLLVWCPNEENALAIGPIHIFDEVNRSWSRKSIFEDLYDKTFWLFDQRQGMTFYTGTYKAINLRKWSPDGTTIYGANLGDIGLNVSALVDSTIIKSEEKTNVHFELKSTIRSLYLDDILKVESLGLQNVGFDEELYTRLKKRFQAQSSRPVILPELDLGDGAEASSCAPKGLKNKRRRVD